MFYYKCHEETNDDPLVYDYVLISNFNSEFVSNSLEEIDDLTTLRINNTYFQLLYSLDLTDNFVDRFTLQISSRLHGQFLFNLWQ